MYLFLSYSLLQVLISPEAIATIYSSIFNLCAAIIAAIIAFYGIKYQTEKEQVKNDLNYRHKAVSEVSGAFCSLRTTCLIGFNPLNYPHVAPKDEEKKVEYLKSIDSVRATIQKSYGDAEKAVGRYSYVLSDEEYESVRKYLELTGRDLMAWNRKVTGNANGEDMCIYPDINQSTGESFEAFEEVRRRFNRFCAWR